MFGPTIGASDLHFSRCIHLRHSALFVSDDNEQVVGISISDVNLFGIQTVASTAEDGGDFGQFLELMYSPPACGFVFQMRIFLISFTHTWASS